MQGAIAERAQSDYVFLLKEPEQVIPAQAGIP
jgi:hypothetical protein